MSKSSWLAAAACTVLLPIPSQQPGDPSVTRDALLEHYARVERELRAAPMPADASRAAARLATLDLLREYRERGLFGANTDVPGQRQPYFVDAAGRRCAVAHLLDRTGNGALTLEVAAGANAAWVADLSTNSALCAWLDRHGLSLEEAARIQAPSRWPPAPPPQPWRPQPVPYNGPGDAAAPQRPSGATPRPATTATPRGPGATTAGTATEQRRSTLARTAMLPTVDLDSEAWLTWFDLQASRWFGPRLLPDIEGATVSNSARTRAITVAREALHDPDPEVRASAALALGKLGIADPELRKHLTDQAFEVRCATVVGLASAGNAAAVHTLLQLALSDADPVLRPLALAVLGRTQHQDAWARRAAEKLLATSQDPLLLAGAAAHVRLNPKPEAPDEIRSRVREQGHASARAVVATSFDRIEDAPAVAALTQAVGGTSLELRRAAAGALGRSRSSLALPALQTAFELEHDLGTRAQLLLAIGEHGGDAAREFLREQVQHGRKALRGWAAVALGLWGRGRDDAALAADVRSARAQENNAEMDGLWLLALGLLGDRGSDELLARQTRTGENSLTRTAAVYALGLANAPACLRILSEALREDSCPALRSTAAHVLAATCGDAATPILLDVARSSAVAELRAEATFALGATGDPAASSALVDLATSAANPAAVRGAALRALGRLHAVDPTLRFASLAWRDGGTLPALFTYLAQLDR